MFHDLDTTIKRILDDPKAPQQLREAEVSFETPKQGYAPAQETVNLFLHQVKENLELRDLAPIRSQVGGVTQQRRPPLRVDCTYMVSAWSPNADASGVVEEHRLLGQALLWLSRFASIPPGYLAGALVGQPFPAPTLVAQLDGDRHSGEFWSALGIAPRPTFSLTVTIALDLGIAPEEGSLVTTVLTDYIAGEPPPDALYQIGGRVLDPAGQGIAGALVDLLDAGLRAVADTKGRYVFNRLPAGEHQLRATAIGFTPAARTLAVPARPEEYEMTLTRLP